MTAPSAGAPSTAGTVGAIVSTTQTRSTGSHALPAASSAYTLTVFVPSPACPTKFDDVQSVTTTPFVAQMNLSAVASVALASNAKSRPFVTTITSGSSEIGSPQTFMSVGFVVSTVHVRFVASDTLPASSLAYTVTVYPPSARPEPENASPAPFSVSSPPFSDQK